MALEKTKKKQIIADYTRGKHDVGSAEVQVALLTERINSLSGHFSSHKKDHHSRHGLIKMVGKRKKLLSYLQKEDEDRYKKLIARLELRK